MIKSVTGPGDRDGGPSATARAEEARRTWPRAAAATPLNSEPTESEAQWKSWLALRGDCRKQIIIVSHWPEHGFFKSSIDSWLSWPGSRPALQWQCPLRVFSIFFT